MQAKPMLREDDIFAGGFFIPKNVVILGTMNDIDRSVESMDFALRRRFERREVKVTEELLRQAFQSGGFGECLKGKMDEAAVDAFLKSCRTALEVQKARP